MKLIIHSLLFWGASLSIASEAASQSKAESQSNNVTTQTAQVVEAAEEAGYIDPKPRVGAKVSLGMASTLGDQALKEPGLVLAPSVLATMNLNSQLYITGEMTMSQYSVPANDDTTNQPIADLKMNSIDPTLLFGFKLSPEVSIFVGPQLNLYFQAEEEVGEVLNDLKDVIESPGYTAVLGSQYLVGDKFFTDLRLNYGLSDILPEQSVSIYSVQLSAGLYL